MRATHPRASAASIALCAVLSSNDSSFHTDAFTTPRSLARRSLPPPLASFPAARGVIATNNIVAHSSRRIAKLHSTIDAEVIANDGASSLSISLVERFLAEYEGSLEEGHRWAEEFGFAEEGGEAAPEGAFYAVFRAISKMDDEHHLNSQGGSNDGKLLGLSGTPFHVSASSLAKAEGSETKNSFSKYFTFPDLASALEEDFLDAQVGSTDNRRGWQVAAVSQPTGSSFDDARMTLAQVETAMESGTIIFNNIGAHIPHLAGATLASTDALSLPGAANMYVTAKGMRTSAPPHTDRQDVLVVQMEGSKRWRVFTPPTDGAVKPDADPFARGKGGDNLPLHVLLEGKEGRLGSELLMDVVTREGDILFIPAGFPHTTDTVEETEDADYDASIHLTFNVDTHVWDLDNLSVRNAALRRNGLKDVLAPQPFSSSNPEINLYSGKINQLPDANTRSQLMDALPLKFLEVLPNDNSVFVDPIVTHLGNLCSLVDGTSAISSESLQEALFRIHSYGSSILDIHRDMLLAAVEEGRLREAEAAMTAHIKDSSKTTKMSQERIQRLSLFRVRKFFEQIETAKKELEQWCMSGNTPAMASSDASTEKSTVQLDSNWQFTAPLRVGDEVEADLGGAFFAAKIAKVAGDTFNVVYFDGDRGDGLLRDQIKLLTPPSSDGEEFDTTGLTKKEIKKLRKKMEKKKRK